MAFSMAPQHLTEASFAEVEEDAQSTEELLPRQTERWSVRRRLALAGLALGALAGCATLLAPSYPTPASTPPAAEPSTVRELLEGPEFVDVVTENFMSIGRGLLGPARRGEVRAAVADNLANISGSLRQRFPADHAKLGLIRLSQVQKDSVLSLLRLYSDPRLQHLGNDIAEAVAETRQSAGDRASLKHRLSEKLRPQLRELRELCDDIAPGTGQGVNLDVDDLVDLEPSQASDGWHFEFEMSPPKVAGGAGSAPSAAGAAATLGRRLAGHLLTGRDTLSGTRDQALTAFQHLEGVLGKTMPKAPARMLLFEQQKAREAQTTGTERFMNCITDNISNPMDIFSCLMTNCRRAMNWLMKKLHLQELMGSARRL